MFELGSEDRLAIATLQSPREMSVPTRLLREAAILVPCAVIFYFAIAWGDGAALWIGPGLYAGYRIYLSFAELSRDRRLGEILRAFEDGLVPAHSSVSAVPRAAADVPESCCSGAGLAHSHSHSHAALPLHDDDHEHEHHHGHHHEHDREEEPDEIHLDPEEAIAACFESAAEDTAIASEHYRLAAKRFRAGKVPRGCAHAFAAFGHLQEARRAARAAASIHADRSAGKG